MADKTEIATTEKRSVGHLSDEGMRFDTISELYEFCKMIVRTPFCPKSLSDPATAMAAILYGRDVGLKPLQSLQSVCVIDGRPAIYGDGFLAVCQANAPFDHGRFEERVTGSGDDLTAYSTVARIGGASITKSFSMREAKAAGLTNKSNWKNFAIDMLTWRARSRACRAVFAAELKGFTSGEEAEDAALSSASVSSDRTPPRSLGDLAAKLESRPRLPDQPPAIIQATAVTPEIVQQAMQEVEEAETKAWVEANLAASAEQEAFEENPDEIVRMGLEELSLAPTIRKIDETYDRYAAVPGLTPKHNTALLQAMEQAKGRVRQAKTSESLW